MKKTNTYIQTLIASLILVLISLGLVLLLGCRPVNITVPLSGGELPDNPDRTHFFRGVEEANRCQKNL